MALIMSLSRTSPETLIRPKNPVTITCAITNNGASSVNISVLRAYVTPHDSAYNLGGGFLPHMEDTIDAGATVYIPIYAVFYAPPNIPTPQVLEYVVGATLIDTDGSVWSAGEITLEVSQEDAAEPTGANGSFIFANPRNSANIIFW